MSKVINNTDLDKISQTVATGKKDKESLRRPVKLRGEWNLDPTKGYQFRTELSYEKGKGVIEIELMGLWTILNGTLPLLPSIPRLKKA
jgi:hypothetical protein